MSKDERKDELAPDGEFLPDREVMSIIPPTPDLAAFGPLPTAAPDAGVITPSPTELPDTDAAASGGGSESITEENRNEQFQRTDTATSET
jgi:hypothetical protein